jgi:hypothetical protein
MAVPCKNKSSKPIDALEKPYYCGANRTSFGAVPTRRLCPAPHRRPFRAAANGLQKTREPEHVSWRHPSSAIVSTS